MSEMTPEEIRAEIAEARRIIREDKIISGHAAIKAKLDKHFPDAPEVPEGTPPAPDPKPEPDDSAGKPKRGGWWGDALDNKA